MSKNVLKAGAILSYILIIVDTLYGLLFVPFLISSLGNSEYGVYRIIASFTNSLAILDFGIGGTMLRFTAKYRAEKDKDSINNFSAMGMIQAFAFFILIATASFFMYQLLDPLYNDSLSAVELAKAKKLFYFTSITIAITPFERVLFGILSGFEEFKFTKGLQIMILVLKMLLLIPLLLKFGDAIVLVGMNLLAVIASILIQFVFLRYKCGVRIKLKKWDNKVFKSSVGYTTLSFIQSIAVQFNSNLDNIVIGAVIGATAVAVYSIGLQLYNMFEHLAMAFSDLMLPTVSRQIAQGADNSLLEDTVIKVGRLEFIVLGGALSGFAIIGKEFVFLWLGETYLWAWDVAIILMIPTMIPLIQNVCLSILRARNKMKFRTIAVCIMAFFNLAITIIGVKLYGPLAASFGTALGLICANIIAMNYYYYRVLHLNLFRIFR